MKRVRRAGRWLHVALNAAFVVASTMSAAAQTAAPVPPTTIVDGVVRYPFADGTPAKIYCSPGTTCDLALERGEIIHDVVCPGSTRRLGKTGWSVDLGSGDRPYIYVTPTASSPTTNLIVTTNRRRYTALLIATTSEHASYAIVPRATPAPEAIPTTTPTPPVSDRAFDVVGTARFRPVSVRREGDLTYIELPDGYYPQPDVAAIEDTAPNGKLVPVGWSWDRDARTLVVQGIFPTLALYVGEGKNQTRVIIRRTQP